MMFWHAAASPDKVDNDLRVSSLAQGTEPNVSVECRLWGTCRGGPKGGELAVLAVKGAD